MDDDETSFCDVLFDILANRPMYSVEDFESAGLLTGNVGLVVMDLETGHEYQITVVQTI